MDRAKAMGSVLDGYHGTDKGFTEFKLPKYGSGIESATGSPVGQLGVSVAELPELANRFAYLNGHTGSNVIPVLHRSDRPARFHLPDDVESHEVQATVADAWGKGFNGLRLENYNNFEDLPNQRFYLLRSPSQIRSRFAAFDPSKKDSANLLASALLGMSLAKENHNDAR